MSSLPGADQAADGEHERLVCLASWAASLAEHDPTWRSLHDEKQHGWASAALDWWWRENDKQYAQQVHHTQHTDTRARAHTHTHTLNTMGSL